MCPRALAPTPLVVYQDDPFNAETPAERLTERFLTPTGLFFVRSHAPVPRVNVESFRLTVRGMVQSALSVSIDDLKRDFRERAVIATLECEVVDIVPVGDHQLFIGRVVAIANDEVHPMPLLYYRRRYLRIERATSVDLEGRPEGQ